MKFVLSLFVGTIGLTTFTGCEVYHDRDQDRRIAEPARYRDDDHDRTYRERVNDRGDRDHDRDRYDRY